MIAFALSPLSFQGPLSSKVCESRAGAVTMSEPNVARRSFLQTVAGVAVAGLPQAALADGANNPTNAARAKQIYGSRIYMLQTGTPADVLEEKNAFQLLITGAFRTVDVKETRKELTALSKEIIAAAEKGTVDKDKLKKFLQVAKVERNYYDDEVGIFNPKQRRNAGAPTTDTVVAQMGNMPYAFYQPTKVGLKNEYDTSYLKTK